MTVATGLTKRLETGRYALIGNDGMPTSLEIVHKAAGEWVTKDGDRELATFSSKRAALESVIGRTSADVASQPHRDPDPEEEEDQEVEASGVIIDLDLVTVLTDIFPPKPGRRYIVLDAPLVDD